MSIYGLTYEDNQRVDETFTSIKQTVPVKLIRKEARFGERALELRVVGKTPIWFDLVQRPIIAGRILQSSDMENHAPVAVLTEFGARRLLAAEHTIGQSLRIGGDYFEIVGIIKSESGKAGNIQIPDQEIDAYIPINIARQYFGDTNMRISQRS